jgi:drug/metabolite transporter (DMT)-like permease
MLAILLAITAIGLLILAPLYVWEFATLGGFEVTLANVLGIAYVALFASVLAYICWNRAVGEVGANKAGLFSHLMPVFSALLAIVFLNEGLQPFHFAGIVLIGLGLYVTTTARRPRPGDSPG